MSTELTPYEGKKPIVMKGGLVHWVSEELADRLQQQLQSQTAHTFIKLRELNITINTAEVEGVYTMEEYGNISKVKQGMWQCEYRTWHNKGKKECECAREARRKHQEAMQKAREMEDNRPETDAERAASRERFRLMNEQAALAGKPGSIFRNMFTKGKPRAIRRSTIDAWEAANGSANLEGLNIQEDVAEATRAEALEILE